VPQLTRIINDVFQFRDHRSVYVWKSVTAVPLAAALAAGPNPNMRRLACAVLAHVGPDAAWSPATRQTLAVLRKDSNPAVRFAACNLFVVAE
jgi:hypothetical protein